MDGWMDGDEGRCGDLGGLREWWVVGGGSLIELDSQWPQQLRAKRSVCSPNTPDT